METGLRLKPRLRREVALTEAIQEGIAQAQALGVLEKNAGAMVIKDAIRDAGWTFKRANASHDRW